MKRNHILQVLLIVLLATAGNTIALSPVPPPHDHVLFSDNKAFCAAVRANPPRTIIKQVRQWWPDKTLWHLPEYFDSVAVSNSGEYVFLCSGAGLVSQVTTQTHILTVWRSDGSTKTFTVGDFVKNLRALKAYQVMGAWMADWGRVTGNQGDLILIETCEKRRLSVNIRTGVISVRPPF